MIPTFSIDTPTNSSLSPILHQMSLNTTDDVAGYTLCLVGASQSLCHLNTNPGHVHEFSINLDGALITQLSCGLDWILLLTDQGRAFSFGNNTYGQLGHGHQQTAPYPTPISFPASDRKVVRISCGTQHGGFVLDSGELYMVGCGTYGRLGTLSEESQSTPIQVCMKWKDLYAQASDINPRAAQTTIPPPEDDHEDVLFTDVSCGDRHTLALGSQPSVVSGRTSTRNVLISFGDGMNGRLGLGSERDQHTGALVTQFRSSTTCSAVIGGTAAPVIPNISMICAGNTHSALVTSSGEIYTWGLGSDGQLGHKTTESEWIPREVEFFRGISMASVKCGARHTIAVSRTGVVYSWGRGAAGQLGIGSTIAISQPQIVSFAIDAAALHHLQLSAQLAAPAGATCPAVDSRVTVRTIVAKENVSIAMDEQSRLFMWGDNSLNQLGTSMGIGEPVIVKPKLKLWQTELREKVPEVSESASKRGQLNMISKRMTTSANTRLALIHVDASDGFTAFLFKTKGNYESLPPTPRLSRDNSSIRSAKDRFSLLRHVTFKKATSDKTIKSQKWYFSLTEELQSNTIPSRENAFYNYMVNYKVHIPSEIPPLNPVDSLDRDIDLVESRQGKRSKKRRSRGDKRIGENGGDLDDNEASTQDKTSKLCETNASSAMHTSKQSIKPKKNPLNSSFGRAQRFTSTNNQRDMTQESTTEKEDCIRPTQLTPKPPLTNHRRVKIAFGRMVHSNSRERVDVTVAPPVPAPTCTSVVSSPDTTSSVLTGESLPIAKSPVAFGSSSNRFRRSPLQDILKDSSIPPVQTQDKMKQQLYSTIGNAEQFSALIGRRLRKAQGELPGPGAYDRHGG